MEFFMPMIPPTVTHQEKAVRIVRGKPQFYEPPGLADARQKLRAHLGRHRPERPMEGAVGLITCWSFPCGSHAPGWKTTRPDTDNLNKLLKDCMTAEGFWKDDAQVCDERIIKRWSETPGIHVWVDML